MSEDPFPDIDLVVYINLNIRTDRRQEMEAELRRLGVPPEKIVRWEATRNAKKPALGCAASHAGVVEYISTLPETVRTILVLEDDFNFAHDASMVKNSLREFLTYPRDQWDMALLSYVILKREDYNGLVSRALASYLASGYLINRRSLPKIVEIFREARDEMSRTGNGIYAIDAHWWHIMKDRKTFYFNTSLGYQRRSYSNLGNEIVTRPSGVENWSEVRLTPHTTQRRT